MSEPTAHKQRYSVDIHEPKDAAGTLVFTFVPQGPAQRANSVSPSTRVPEFVVAVRQEADQSILDWTGTPDDPGAAKEEIETDVLARMSDRTAWIGRVGSLVEQLQQWAGELGWSSRRVEKTLADARTGEHRVPALLMQEDTCRILLEPVGRAAPGADGVVDLYLMPAYDDIASLYYNQNRWNLHYMFPGAGTIAAPREFSAIPLTKDVFESVISQMKQHAA